MKEYIKESFGYNNQFLKREIKNAIKLRGKKMMNLFHEYHETEKKVYLIYEFLEGPSLCEFINLKQPSIQEIKIIMFQALKGLKSMEKQNILHRNLKSSNLKFKNSKYFNSLKFIDFDYSTDKKNLKAEDYNPIGTIGYIAPELFDKIEKDDYCKLMNSKIEIFSLGVILYEMVFRKFLMRPGKGDIDINKFGLFLIPRRSEMKTEMKCPHAYDLLKKMLDLDPEKRISIEGGLSHKFFKNGKESFYVTMGESQGNARSNN